MKLFRALENLFAQMCITHEDDDSDADVSEKNKIITFGWMRMRVESLDEPLLIYFLLPLALFWMLLSSMSPLTDDFVKGVKKTCRNRSWMSRLQIWRQREMIRFKLSTETL